MATSSNKPDVKKKNPLANLQRIGIAGAGGIGGFVVSGLFDYGVNRKQFPFNDFAIDLFDDDIVDTGNLLHQNFTEDDLGKQKAKLLSDRYFVNPVLRFMKPEDFVNYQLVFSCVDSMEFRKQLYEYGYKHPEFVWIDGRCNSRQIGLFHSLMAAKALNPTLTDTKARAGCLRQVDKENKVSHITPQIIAGMMLQTFLNMLRSEQMNDPHVLYI